MATLKTLPIVGDSGSQELAQLLSSYNALLDAFGDMVTAIKSATLVSDIVTAVTTAEAALEANVPKIRPTYQVPLARHFKTE